jgi:hypothetical protein
VTVLPDDVGGLRAFVELEFLTKEGQVGVDNHIGKHSRLVALENDES